jgi:protein gp37
MAKRLKGMGSAKYQRDGDPRTSGPGFGITTHPDVLNEPFTWRKPRKVFVNSMSDLFHARVPLDFIRRVFEVIEATPQHTYQVLTKRASRLPKVADRLPWPRNLWMGVSVEDQEQADLRIPPLLETPAAVRWISAEPLLGPIDLCGPIVDGHRPRLTYWLTGRPGWGNEHTTSTGLTMTEPVTGPRLDWVVCGGESGPGARPMGESWARSIVDQCQQAGVPVFVKQMGSVWAKGEAWEGPSVSALGDRKGGDWRFWPEDLRVREFPATATAVTA